MPCIADAALKRMEYHALASTPQLLLDTRFDENESAGKPNGPVPELTSPLEDRVRELEATLREREAAFELRLRQEREQGYATAREELEADSAKLTRARLHQLDAAAEALAVERDAYFGRLEREAVKLSLAIAARILHREAQLDPLLLTGVVRMAFDQLQEGTVCSLQVPSAEERQWQEWVQTLRQQRIQISVVPDPSLEAGDCRIEMPLGSVSLGVKAQLAEIERGFFDLLDQRPPSREKART